MATPSVHILMPTYEPRADHLRAAVESVLAQTERKWQLLVHDDASAADVEAMIEPYLTDKRIGFFRSPKRRGIGANWNACLKFARSPYVQYLFQDDTWAPTYLEEALHVMKAHPNIGFLSAHHAYASEGMELPESYRAVLTAREEVAPGLHDGRIFLRWWIERGLHPNVIGEPSFVMIRRSVIARAGRFADDMHQGLDMDQWLRMLQETDWFWIPKSLGTFRVHPQGTSAQNQEAGIGLTDRLECFQRLIARLPKGDLRSLAVTARNKALTDMAKKYVRRTRNQEPGTRTKSNGMMRKFALRHPITTARAMLAAMRTKEA